MTKLVLYIVISFTGLFATHVLSQDTPVQKAFEHIIEVMDRFHTFFDVYTDVGSAGNHFLHRAWMGDLKALDVDECCTVNPHSGLTCIKNTFCASANNWVGVYFQNGAYLSGDTKPRSNWGDYSNAGIDLTGVDSLTFWAHCDSGSGERVEFYLAGVGRDPNTGLPNKAFPESSPKISMGWIRLDTVWKEYRFNLKGRDLSYVLGGFGWATNAAMNNNKKVTFFLDDIKFHGDPNFNSRRLAEPRFILSYETINSNNPCDTVLRSTAFTYDNALAMLAFMARGTEEDWRRAQLIADAFLYAQKHDREFNDGRLRNAYQAGDLHLPSGWLGGKTAFTTRLCGWWDCHKQTYVEDQEQVGSDAGNMAWVMIALLTYFNKSNDKQYLESADLIGRWIYENCYSEAGLKGYTGGFERIQGKYVKRGWKSTEHTIDIYVAFMRLASATGDSIWRKRAFHAKRFFLEAMWNPAEQHFWTGTNTKGDSISKIVIPLDVQTWSLMAIGEKEKYSSGLSWIENHCYVNPCQRCGKIKGPDYSFSKPDSGKREPGIWYEGLAQTAVSYQIIHNATKANESLTELRRVQREAKNSNGKGIVAACHDSLTTGFGWSYNNRVHLGATTWFIFAELQRNPYWDIKTNEAIPYDGLSH